MGRSEETPSPEVDAAELLELLGDEYTREVLQTLAAEPRTGREIVATAEASKATVYRRLDRLSEAGLVESSTKLDPDGHHREQFRITFDGARCTVSESGIEAELTSRGRSDDTSREEQPRREPSRDRPQRRTKTTLLKE